MLPKKKKGDHPPQTIPSSVAQERTGRQWRPSFSTATFIRQRQHSSSIHPVLSRCLATCTATELNARQSHHHARPPRPLRRATGHRCTASDSEGPLQRAGEGRPGVPAGRPHRRLALARPLVQPSERRHPVRVHRAGVCPSPRAAPSRVLGQMECGEPEEVRRERLEVQVHQGAQGAAGEVQAEQTEEREGDPGQVLPAGRRVGRRRLLHGGDDGPGEERLHIRAQEESWGMS